MDATKLKAGMTAMIAGACALLLSGCGQSAAVEKAVKDALKDPDSAKFGKIYIDKYGSYACVDVNARNAMGGYTGKSAVLVAKRNGSWVYDQQDENHLCSQDYVDTKTPTAPVDYDPSRS